MTSQAIDSGGERPGPALESNATRPHSDGAAPGPSTYESVVQAENKRVQRDWVFTQVMRLLAGVALIAVWQAASTWLIDPFYVSSPKDVVARLGEWAETSVLWTNLWATLRVALGGFVLGSLTGAATGFFLGLNRRLASILDPWIQAVYAIPKIALAPVFILWFGVDDTMRILLTGMMVFFLVFWTSYAAVRAVDRELIDVARLMGAGRLAIVVKVVAPGSLPGVLNGLKMSVPYALIGAVVGELLASSEGIGFLMQQAASQYDTAGLMAGLVVLMVVAVALNWLVSATDYRLNKWQM